MISSMRCFNVEILRQVHRAIAKTFFSLYGFVYLTVSVTVTVKSVVLNKNLTQFDVYFFTICFINAFLMTYLLYYHYFNSIELSFRELLPDVKLRLKKLELQLYPKNTFTAVYCLYVSKLIN